MLSVAITGNHNNLLGTLAARIQCLDRARGTNICKTQSVLPEVAKQPRMLGRSGGMPPPQEINAKVVIENAKYVISCRFLLIFTTYNSSKVNYILNNNILYFKLSCVDI